MGKEDTQSDLTSRLPLRQHLKNAGRMMRLVRQMDKYWVPSYLVVHLIHVLNNYLALVLSAYILDALAAGEIFEVIFKRAALVCVAIFLFRCIEVWIQQRLDVRQNIMFDRYHSMTEIKMLEMDFAKINSPECNALRQRIRNDMNYSKGIYSVFQDLNILIYCLMSLVGAVAVGFPVIKLLFAPGQYVVWIVLIVSVAVSVASTKFSAKCDKALLKKVGENCWDNPDLPLDLAWDFSDGNGFQYQNGKDIRIYGGYRMMKKYALDNHQEPGHRKILGQLKKYEGGAGFCYVMSSRILEGGSYVILAILAIAGSVSIGNVIKYAGCIKQLFGEIDHLMKVTPRFFLMVRKHLSTLDLLELKDDMYKGKLPVEKRSDGEYQIEFRNVSFRYPETEQYALKNFSMKLKIGEKLAVVGMNGSGKTTMIKLLCRLYDPEEGEILLNGVNIKKFRQNEYSQLFSVVFQDFQLFSFMLGENVAVGREYDKEKVAGCLEDAGLGERLKGLSSGVDTYLYKDYADGLEISGGEAQKIAIARAVYKEAPFILLDEPTAALDPISEYEVYTSFDSIIGNKTAIYISHRLSSCRFCDKIAVFHEGRLVQTGSHEELVKDKEGRYYEMWNAQAQYYQ